MKAFVVLFSTLTTCLARPSTVTSSASAFSQWSHSPSTNSFSAPSLSAQTLSQYHTQDYSGQASFGYAHPGQAHAVFQDEMGNVKGSYAYVDPDGKQVQVHYVADSNGFRVVSNDLAAAPTPVEDTPEVKQAKAAHFAAIAAAQARSLAAESNDFAPNPQPAARQPVLQPLEDTPEVKAAKNAHFSALASARSLAQANEFTAPAPQPAPVQFQATPTFGEKFGRQSHDSGAQWASTGRSFAADPSPAFPVEVEDTPDVKAAKAAHFAAIAAARARNLAAKAENNPAPIQPLPSQPIQGFGAQWSARNNGPAQPTFQATQGFGTNWAANSRSSADAFSAQVEDTPEVRAAKAAHFAALAAARARNLAAETDIDRPAPASQDFDWSAPAPARFPANVRPASFRAHNAPIAVDLTAASQPVEDTPEVKAAKAEHFAAIAAAQARSLALSRSRSVRR